MGRYCPNPECPDRVRTGEAGEFRDDVEACPFCGTLLVAEAPPAGPDARSEPPPFSPEPRAHEVPVFLARDATEAELVRGLLENEGIVAIARIRNAENLAAFFSATWAPVPGQVFEVLVSSAALHTARELLESTFGPDHPGLSREHPEG